MPRGKRSVHDPKLPLISNLQWCLTMLATSKIVAFLATTNAATARDFYEFVLGLKFVSADDFALVFEANDVELRVQKVRSLAPQTHAQLGWSVADIEDVVRVLGAKALRSNDIHSLTRMYTTFRRRHPAQGSPG